MDGMRRDMIYSMIKEKISVIFVHISDYNQNYFTIQEAIQIRLKRFSNESEVIDVDSSYNNLISFLIGEKY